MCRKNGLDCSTACGACKSQSCSNSPTPDLDEGSVTGVPVDKLMKYLFSLKKENIPFLLQKIQE